MVLSASTPYATSAYGDSLYFFERNVIFAVIGLIAMLVVSFIPNRLYEKYAWQLFFIAVVMGVMVLIPGIGRKLNNARRWIFIGSFSFMPSDVLKIGSVIVMARLLAKNGLEKNRRFPMFVTMMIIIAIPIGLIFLQPDFSTMSVTAMGLMMLYLVGGMNLKHILLLIVLAVLGVAVAFTGSGSGLRVERILAFLDPIGHKQDHAWQLVQSLYAVSSGGLFGVGLGQGRQKFDYLAAEPHNDFIFATIGEELGFVGSAFVVLMYAYFIYRGILIARKASSHFGRLVAFGLTFIIGLQAAVNISVSIGMVPPTGLTLPFISYGGSSLVATCMMVGILLNISRPKVEDRLEDRLEERPEVKREESV